MKNNLRAFTLVELIVVITIVGILSTIGFISYSGYLTGARDSNRFSQLTSLSNSLQVYSTSNRLPIPDDYVQVTANGSNNVIAYQGYVGVKVLETVNYTNGGKDPKDDTFFTYYLTQNRKSMQLLMFMEEDNILVKKDNTLFLAFDNVQAGNYEERFPKVYGKKLGILTQSFTNTPIQEVTAILNGSGYLDVVQTSDEYTAYVSNDEIIIGTGSELQVIVPNSSCKRIKQTGGARGNGSYPISPADLGTFMAYCNMDVAGGGWTHIGSKISGGDNSVGIFGSLQTIPGEATNITFPDIGISEKIKYMMACSTENCWQWETNSIMRDCLKNSCNTQNGQNILVERVAGDTGFQNIVATSFWYNLGGASLPALFDINNGSVGLGANANRWDMDGGASGSWTPGDQWDIYVK